MNVRAGRPAFAFESFVYTHLKETFLFQTIQFSINSQWKCQTYIAQSAGAVENADYISAKG